ncbi:NAD(P)/FAD-dependent oxidoreductase [Halorhodospira halophila]|uniref:Sulfide dehydrogenase (Flavocytochrome), flavoprotein subunit n=1 Tax=Halorhodospira halophila (strain DSM 244 / SL1) TaxID=349124 RepID=A1WWN6_HALHL|nr:NAD(P)/FAD-dependent oxidoreductase [Halorhodospira halophila]ABM62098.1 sulfide dehydrogenase (flavocytochrome), flavoprotein subunit [Halorhodospira halophila SL1]MBK1729426.1 cytochrome C [Halorhodospira halophila]
MRRRLSRREFLRLGATGGTLAALGLAGFPGPSLARTQLDARIAVVGGGSAGATVARYLKQNAPNLRVTLIEPNETYYTCYAGNWYLGGFRDLETLGHGYDNLRERHGVEVIHDRAEELDLAGKRVLPRNHDPIRYDRLVVAPGIDFDWERIEGIDQDDTEQIPHAWEGGRPFRILREQIKAMDDGGTVIVCPPEDPFRCPPGPYERMALIAHYLKSHKPRAKVLGLDPKDSFSKQSLFKQGWEELYGDMIEWVPGSEGGAPERLSVSDRKVFTDGGAQAHRGDVINFIPPQRAGAIAWKADLVDDSGWCPVDQETFRSQKHDDVYVIGDAAIAGAMPKSAHSANNQGKLVAATIVGELTGEPTPDFPTVNTCYSLVSPEWAFTIAAVFEHRDGEIREVEGSGGLSPEDEDQDFRQIEAIYAPGWYESITKDMFG